MNYKQLNEVFKQLRNIKLKKVSTNQSTDFYEEKTQGDEGERVDVYELGFDDLYLKITTVSDSYGNNESIDSIQFVKPIVKQVTDFEPVK